MNNRYYIYFRSLIFLVIFLLFHYLYKWFPNIIFFLFSAIDESVYQHFKNAFYSYIILTVIEYFFFRKRIQDKKKFIFSHLLSSILISWVIFILFLSAAMFFDERHFIIEIIYANIIAYLTAISVSVLEEETKKLEYSKRLMALILFLFVLLVMEFTIFTFRLPWHDIFTNPYS